MATIWERIFGSRTARQIGEISTQLNEMRSTSATLQQQNNLLNSLLSIQFRQQGGFTRFDTVNQIDFIRNGYNINADIYSVVSDIAQKGASIPLVCYEVIDDNALKNYKASRKGRPTDDNLILSNKLKTKALRQVEYDNPIQKLIDKPNADDDPFNFYQTSIGFTCICGNNYWYTPTLDMGADKGKVIELRIMPSQFTGIVVTQGFPARVLGYEVIIDGLRLLQSAEVIHMKFPNYDWSVDGQQFYGLSPLKAGFNLLNLSNAIETTQISSFNNGGPAVLITNKSISPDERAVDQMGRIKKAWNDEYTGPTNANKFKLMAGDVSAIPLGLDNVSLDIIAADERVMDKICNLYGISSIMFNNHSASTESNVKEMIRDSWTRGILPLRKMHADSFNRAIVPAYQQKGVRYFVDMDLSGIADLQPDKAIQATWLNTSWWIPPNEKRKIQDIDEISDPNMDKVYIPQNLVALDDQNIDVTTLPNAPQDNFNDGNTNT
jgi:HK97 family phage portal protein